jgi:hypothetical protein
MCTINCFQGLSVSGCTLFNCRRKNKDNDNDNDNDDDCDSQAADDDVLIVYGENGVGDGEVCVIGPGSMDEDVILTDGAMVKGEWDCLVVDHRHRIVSLTGPRFQPFCTEDDCSGWYVKDVFHGNFLRVVESLVHVVVSKRGVVQVDTLYEGLSLTMHAYSMNSVLHNRSKETPPIGACIVYRPTEYNTQVDIEHIIRGTTPSPVVRTSIV